MTHKSYTTNTDCLQLPLGYTSIPSYNFWKAFTKQLQEVLRFHESILVCQKSATTSVCEFSVHLLIKTLISQIQERKKAY